MLSPTLTSSSAEQCKHLLACRIADRIDAWENKRVSLEWLAGLATKFGAAVPPLLAAAAAPTTHGSA